jgi:ribosomal protein S8
MNKSLVNKLIQLKNASILNNGIITTIYLRSLVSLLFFLYKEGIIQSYETIIHPVKRLSKLIIHFRQYAFQSTFNELKLLSSKSNALSLRYKDFLKISSKDKTLVISTTEGFRSVLDCKKKRLGGIVLFSC